MMFCAAANPSNFVMTYITPLASPLIALAVGVVAYQQWRTARDKLRFDLYARRLGVYDAAMDYLEMAIKLGNDYAGDEVEVRRAYVRAWRESRFLFGKDSKVYGILSDMQNHAITVMTPANAATVLYDEVGRKAAMERRSQSLNWLLESADRLSNAIEPFLDFRRLQRVHLGRRG